MIDFVIPAVLDRLSLDDGIDWFWTWAPVPKGRPRYIQVANESTLLEFKRYYDL